MEYLYIRSNPDWDFKYKFGYVGPQPNGLINRLKSSITEHSDYCRYVTIYGIIKKDNYNSYREFDKIFYLPKYPTHSLLEDFKQYLVGSRLCSEFMKKEGLELFEKIVYQVFPFYNLECIKKFTQEEIQDLEKEAIESFEKSKIITREYQDQTLTKMIQYYKIFDIGKLLWACGLGKTLMSLFFIKEMGYKKICIGVPSVYLQSQFRDEIFFDNVCILINGSFKFIDKEEKRIIFYITTYHSSKYLVRDDLIFDFKIGDEAHHLVTGFQSFHKIKSRKTLYMTATEKIVIGDRNIYSMDNREIFGDVIDSKNIKWSIENNMITDYNILILRNNKDEVDQILSSLKDVDRNLFISCYLTVKAITGGQFPMLRHLLIYTNKTENADKVITYLDMLIEDKEDFYLCSLHSKNSKKIESEIEKFKESKFGIISCVYILGEGFNLPKLTGVVIAEKMDSEIRIVQSCLRANRKDFENPNKEAYIIIPSSEDNEADNFQKVKQVVENFMNSDEDVMMKIKCLGVSDLKKKSKDKKKEKKVGNIQNDEEFEKLKLKLIKSGDFKNGMSYEEYEYNVLRNFNIRRGVIDIEGYIKSKEDRSYFIDYPKTYFAHFGIWKNWYHFLGVSMDDFIPEKDEWKSYCLKLGINNKKKYYEICKTDKKLPLLPEEIYYEFSGVDSELNLIPYIY